LDGGVNPLIAKSQQKWYAVKMINTDKRYNMATKKYKSGTFCIDIACPRHKKLESLEGDAYLKRKKVHCKNCYAWNFLIWLNKHDYRIIMTIPEISAKELSARLKGIDPSRVEDLTIDEILTL